MPVQNVNINNVSMDYFLRGVEAAKPKNAPQVPQEAQAGANAVAAPELEAAGKMVSQLDVLLMKAAKVSTQSLDGKRVKNKLQNLVADGVLSRDSLNLLAKTADTAAKTLKALDKFTGRQLAEAFDKKGDFDASTKVGKAIAAAVKAQQDLSDLLAQLSTNLDAISRHEDEVRQANPQFKGVDAELFNEVNDLRQLCDRRATEINHLAYQMKDFAVHLAAQGKNADPNVVAILKAKVNELLPRQALAMHGTADALATVSEEVSSKLRPIAEKIDAFRRNPSAAIGTDEFHALQSDIATMKAALRDIRKNGIAVEGGRMVVAKDIVKALEWEVAKAEELFKTARHEVMRKVIANYVETAKSVLCEEPGYENQFGYVDTAHINGFECRDDVLEAMDVLAEAAKDPKKTPKELNALYSDLYSKGMRLMAAAKNAKWVNTQSATRLNKLFGRFAGIGNVIEGLSRIIGSMYGNDKFFTGAEAMAVFQGKLSVSSVVEARARGLQDSDVDPANEDANIVSKNLLGSGAVGTVYELTRSDGKHVVFKGETESRTGLSALSAGSAKSYGTGQMAVNLNFASKKAAVALGMGGLIVDYSAGSHNGVFGFYMEKAKGVTPGLLRREEPSTSSETGLSVIDIRRLPVNEQLKILADLKRELNRLHWLDLLTGQTDRHWDNYFVHIDVKTHKVTVKGIDNDACYSQYRTGATRFSFDKNRAELFKAKLLNVATKIDSGHANDEYAHLLADPGITADENGGLTIDASKVRNKAVIYALKGVTGAKTLAVPDKIDSETYNALMELKAGPKRDAYLDSIRPRLSQDSYNAAVSRLDDVIAHAEKLKDEGRIVQGNGWQHVRETPLQTGKVTVQKRNGQNKQIGGDIASVVNELTCPSYFARDKLSKIFA